MKKYKITATYVHPWYEGYIEYIINSDDINTWMIDHLDLSCIWKCSEII